MVIHCSHNIQPYWLSILLTIGYRNISLASCCDEIQQYFLFRYSIAEKSFTLINFERSIFDKYVANA